MQVFPTYELNANARIQPDEQVVIENAISRTLTNLILVFTLFYVPMAIQLLTRMERTQQWITQYQIVLFRILILIKPFIMKYRYTIKR